MAPVERSVIWFEDKRIPTGRWPFLNAARHSLISLQELLVDAFDMKEGGEVLLVTGCMQAYRIAVVRRVFDLSQSVVALWNAGLLTGSVVCARALLETIAMFHSFLVRAEALASAKDWSGLSRLVDSYSFSVSVPGRKAGPDDPPRVGRAVRDFLSATQPGSETFWDQICDAAHPNGDRMMSFAGTVNEQFHYIAKPASANEPIQFIPIFNALHSCCWLMNSDDRFEILLEVICTGDPLPADHPLVVQRADLDGLTANVIEQMGRMAAGPAAAEEKKSQPSNPADTSEKG